MIATQHLQRMLDDAWDAAPDGALTLRESLRASEKELSELLRTGQVQSVGKNSANQSYAFGQGALTLPQIAEAWRNLINLFDACQEIITADEQEVNDDNIVAEMRARLRPIYATRPDLTNLQCA